MDFAEYQAAAMRTAGDAYDPGLEHGLNLSALGLTGETGEFADTIKKWLYQDHPLDKGHLTKELGDILWYVARACMALDVTLEEVARQNIDKLERRYPNGFSSEASRNRVDYVWTQHGVGAATDGPEDVE